MILNWTVAAMQQRIDQAYRAGDEDSGTMLEGILELYEAGEMEITFEGGQPLYRWQCDIDPPPADLLIDD
jgi:hypothetical protein